MSHSNTLKYILVRSLLAADSQSLEATIASMGCVAALVRADAVKDTEALRARCLLSEGDMCKLALIQKALWPSSPELEAISQHAFAAIHLPVAIINVGTSSSFLQTLQKWLACTRKS